LVLHYKPPPKLKWVVDNVMPLSCIAADWELRLKWHIGKSNKCFCRASLKPCPMVLLAFKDKKMNSAKVKATTHGVAIFFAQGFLLIQWWVQYKDMQVIMKLVEIKMTATQSRQIWDGYQWNVFIMSYFVGKQ